MFSTTDLEELAQFLVKAKMVTYASGKQEYAVNPALAGSHQLEYSNDGLHYRDVYYGGMHFIGMETVFRKDQPIWGMCYYGGVLPDSNDEQIAGMPPFLKAALSKVPLEAPYRGPKTFQMGDYFYENEIHGDIFSFSGIELIRIQGHAIYNLRYSGGLVKP
jgi:hypothetical protein